MTQPPTNDDLSKTITALIESSAYAKEIRGRIINIEMKIDVLIRREVYLTPREVSALMGDLGDQVFGSRSYSQHGDDFIILNIFETLKIPRPSYLDIGAHDPYKISNTALLYHRGSRGINVDANPNLIDAFRVQRPGDINLNVGVGSSSGTLTYYMFDDRSGLNTLDERQARLIETTYGRRVKTTIEVPVVTIAEILREHCPHGFPDFLSIDVEGMDLELLKSIDYSGSTPKLICVEANTVDLAKEINEFMERVGYELVFRAAENLFFIRADLKNSLKP